MVLTGAFSDFLEPVKMSAASMDAFADPCFPGFDVLIEMILHGESSMFTYLPTFNSLISFISHMTITSFP